MASGAEHARIARNIMYATWTGSTLLTGLVDLPLAVSLGLSVGALSGYIVTPDSDIENPTYEDARVYHYWGNTAGRSWEWFWSNYALRYSHRGVSHKPFYGTYTRWRYVGQWVVLPLIVVLTMYFPNWLFNLTWAGIANILLYLASAFLMHTIQDLGHLWKDNWGYHENDA